MSHHLVGTLLFTNPRNVILKPVKKRNYHFGRILSLVTFPVLIIGSVIAAIVFRDDIWRIFSSSENIQSAVVGWGAAAPLAFIALQFVQVVIFVIPGEVPQIAGGFLFGLLKGTLYSVTGILLGSSFNFVLARILGVPFVHSLFKDAQISKFEKITKSSRAQIAFFLLFVIPGIPKDILCYAAGLTSMRFVGFLLISTVGRLPGIIGSAAMGDAAASNRWVLAGIIMAVATALFIIGILYRDRIHSAIEKLATRDKKPQSK